MRKRGLLTAAFLLFLSAGLLARAPGCLSGKMERPGQPERPKFYAVRVVSEKEVLNAKNSLGAPDGGYTEILPGGQLVVIMEKELYFSPIVGDGGALDSGSIVGKGGAEIDLEGWFPMQDTQGKQYHDWMPLGISGTGFLISSSPEPINSFEGSSGVDMIKITNHSTKSLFVDAVIGYDLKAERSQESARWTRTSSSAGTTSMLWMTLSRKN